MTAQELETIFYKKSGLLGIYGISSDMRQLLKSHEPAARLAVDYFVYRAAEDIGALAAGIGENPAEIRHRIVQVSGWLGIDGPKRERPRGRPNFQK